MSTIEEQALLIARERMREINTREMWLSPNEHEIRIVEIVRGADSVRGQVCAFRFAPDPPDITFPLVTVLLNVEDWKVVQSGKLALPSGFQNLTKIADRKAMPRRSQRMPLIDCCEKLHDSNCGTGDRLSDKDEKRLEDYVRMHLDTWEDSVSELYRRYDEAVYALGRAVLSELRAVRADRAGR